MRRTLMLAMLAAIPLLIGACVEYESRQTVFLEADGSVTWLVELYDVRCTDDDPDEQEEFAEAWLREARSGGDWASAALSTLVPWHLESHLERDRPPFAVRAEASFPSPRFLVESVLLELGAAADVWIEVEADGRQRLVLRIDPPVEDVAAIDDDAPIVALLAELDEIELVAVGHRFVAGRGFAIEDGGRKARILSPDGDEATATDDGGFLYELTWAARPTR